MVEDRGGLQSGLKRRHVTMISLGGVIGAGLFVGSGAVINQTGPAAVLSYLAAGALVILVMRMLGEMAVAHPSTGSFADYAGIALGDWARFAVGWLYRYFGVIVLAVEAAAGAAIIEEWLPGVPIWASSLVLMIALTATNLVSVRSYGEFEFWFASIKVAAIIAFILVAAGYVVTGGGVEQLTANGGFAPEGGVAILAGIVIVIFAFVGAEIATIAAAESDEPGESVRKASQLGDHARARLLRAVGVPDRGDPPVGLGGARQVAVHGRAGRDRHPGRRAGDERDRADRGAVVPELRAVRRVADELRAGAARRRAAVDGAPQRPRRAGARDPDRHLDPLPVGDRQRDLAREGVPVPAQLVRRPWRCSSTC
jgi:hypothetical protein